MTYKFCKLAEQFGRHSQRNIVPMLKHNNKFNSIKEDNMRLLRVLTAAFVLTSVHAQATSSATFTDPTVMTINGSEESFFVNATNGEYFCEGFGFNSMSGGTIQCGEDESAYANYNWYNKVWEYEDTGSKNQCYPLFKTITCVK